MQIWRIQTTFSYFRQVLYCWNLR